ncbi:MAG TPA: OB-fold nucleic acid binding domain-containing protein [Kribbellaceae bacterium]|jgi:hypothetical protein
MGGDKPAGVFRRVLRGLASTQDEREAEELQDLAAASGARSITRCGDRETVTIAGTLRTVTFSPRGGVPALEGELYDGTGTVTLLWLGRRRIAGIQPGVELVASGRLTTVDGNRAMFNPRYELRPSVAH